MQRPLKNYLLVVQADINEARVPAYRSAVGIPFRAVNYKDFTFRNGTITHRYFVRNDEKWQPNQELTDILNDEGMLARVLVDYDSAYRTREQHVAARSYARPREFTLWDKGIIEGLAQAIQNDRARYEASLAHGSEDNPALVKPLILIAPIVLGLDSVLKERRIQPYTYFDDLELREMGATEAQMKKYLKELAGGIPDWQMLEAARIRAELGARRKE